MAGCALNSGATETEKTWLNGEDDFVTTGTRCENIAYTGQQLLNNIGWFADAEITTLPPNETYNFKQLTLEMTAFESSAKLDFWANWASIPAANNWPADKAFPALFAARMLPKNMQIGAPTEKDVKNATSMRYIFKLAEAIDRAYGTTDTKGEVEEETRRKADKSVRRITVAPGGDVVMGLDPDPPPPPPAYDNSTILGEAERLKALIYIIETAEWDPREWNSNDIGTTVSRETSHGKWTGTARAYSDVKTDWLAAAKQYVALLENLNTNVYRLRQYNESHKEVIKGDAEATKDELKDLQAKQTACKMVAAGKGDVRVPGTGMVLDTKASALCPSPGTLTDAEKARLAALIAIRDRAKTVETAGLETMIAASQEPTRRIFKEQCLLLSHLEQFVQYRWMMDDEGKRVKRIPYKSENLQTSELKRERINGNATLLADREAWGFMNQLVQDPSYAALFNIENKYLSQLQPMIKLYKVSTASGADEKDIEVNFDNAFNSKFDSVLGNTKKRGFGVGIQSFTFSYEGSDPFAVKKSIKAKLSIFAASFDDLLVDRGGYRYADLALKTGRGYKDKLSADNQTKIPALEDLNFRLKAVVGWSVPVGGEIIGATDSQSRSIKDAINNSFVTLNLTPTIHEFDINEQGQVVFHINYLAYVDQYFDGQNFNIFTNLDVQTREIVRKNKFYQLQRDCNASNAQEKIDELKEKEAEQIYDDKTSQLQTIISEMIRYRMIYYKAIPTEELINFNSQGPYWDFDLFKNQGIGTDSGGKLGAQVQEGVKGQVEDKVKQQKSPLPSGETPDLSETVVSDINKNQYIAFFFLSDLIDVIMQGIDLSLFSMPHAIAQATELDGTTKKNESDRFKRLYKNYKQFRVLLGPLELRTPKSGLEHFDANLGDIPISVSYFMDWLTDRTIKNDSTSYSLPIFLKDLLNNLVRNFLNEDRCFDLNIKQRVRVFSSAITSYSDPNWAPYGVSGDRDEITKWIVARKNVAGPGPGGATMPGGKSAHFRGLGNRKARRLDMRSLMTAPVTSGHVSAPLLHVFGDRNTPINTRDFENMYNYQVFYAGRVQPQSEMSGDETLDSNAGVFHFVLGKPNGIVKNIQLSKTDAPGLKEVRFEQEGYDGLLQLREVYDANITCYGSPNIVPGTYIYVNPRGFSPESKHYKDIVGTSDKRVIDNASLTRYGIGGYYMVTRAETTFGPGTCETELTAKWVAELSTRKSAGKHTGGSPGPRKPAKCR